MTLHDDSFGRYSEISPKVQHPSVPPPPPPLPIDSTTDVNSNNDQKDHIDGENDKSSAILQDEAVRKRELVLRQYAFFQLRLHLRRGTNLVAMDRCGG